MAVLELPPSVAGLRLETWPRHLWRLPCDAVSRLRPRLVQRFIGFSHLLDIANEAIPGLSSFIGKSRQQDWPLSRLRLLQPVLGAAGLALQSLQPASVKGVFGQGRLPVLAC